jgi:catechol 2,3-dioxygenase-like lactoylglutathione lyase family enzyme
MKRALLTLLMSVCFVAGCRTDQTMLRAAQTGEERKTMATVNVTGLNVLAIYVTDLERARLFYTDHLGFEPCGDYPPGLLLRAGGITIYLEGGHKLPAPQAPKTVGVSPCFSTESVKATFTKLKAAGVNIVAKYQEFSAAYATFKITDPDGHVIEFAGKP